MQKKARDRVVVHSTSSHAEVLQAVQARSGAQAMELFFTGRDRCEYPFRDEGDWVDLVDIALEKQPRFVGLILRVPAAGGAASPTGRAVAVGEYPAAESAAPQAAGAPPGLPLFIARQHSFRRL